MNQAADAAGESCETPGAETALLRQRVALYPDWFPRSSILTSTCVLLQAVTRLAQHYGRSPDRISKREVKAYLLHLHRDEKRSTSTCNVAAAALRFLYHLTLGRSRTDFDVPIARKPMAVLSPRLLEVLRD